MGFFPGILECFFFFLSSFHFFGHAVQLKRCKFPDQGLMPGSSSESGKS